MWIDRAFVVVGAFASLLSACTTECLDRSLVFLRVKDATTGNAICDFKVEAIDGEDVVASVGPNGPNDGQPCPGAFDVPPVDSGTYVLRVTADGYQPLEVTVEIERNETCETWAIAPEGQAPSENATIDFPLSSL